MAVLLGQRSLRTRFVVPDIFWIEVANALGARNGLPADVVLGAVAELDGVGFDTVQVGRPGLLASIALMADHGLTAYDATYLVLAESLGAELLTLDRRLAAAAGTRAVRLDAGGIDEPRAPYRLKPWIAWDEASAYLAAVREVALDEARSG